MSGVSGSAYRRFLAIACRSISRAQSFDDALHLHAARAFYQQQVTWSQKFEQEGSGIGGGWEKVRILTRQTALDRSFHKFGCVALNANNAVQMLGDSLLAGVTVQHRRFGP
jgi:hypothetical protein